MATTQKRKYTIQGAVRFMGGTEAGLRMLNQAIVRLPMKPRSPIMNHLTAHPNVVLVIAPEKKFIFLKVAKAAGSSVYDLLKRDVKSLITRTETPWRYLHWLKNTTDEYLKKYYRFTLVRHPLDRLISTYWYFQMNQKMNFHDYVQLVTQQKGSLKICMHTEPQHRYVETPEGPFVNFVGSFENLKKDWEIISKKICIS